MKKILSLLWLLCIASTAWSQTPHTDGWLKNYTDSLIRRVKLESKPVSNVLQAGWDSKVSRLNPKLGTSSTIGHVWTATGTDGSGSFQAPAGATFISGNGTTFNTNKYDLGGSVFGTVFFNGGGTANLNFGNGFASGFSDIKFSASVFDVYGNNSNTVYFGIHQTSSDLTMPLAGHSAGDVLTSNGDGTWRAAAPSAGSLANGNGTTWNGTGVDLGGNQTGDIAIDGLGIYSLQFINSNLFNLQSEDNTQTSTVSHNGNIHVSAGEGGTSGFSLFLEGFDTSGTSTLQVNGTTTTFQNTGTNGGGGIKYGGDYSAGYTNRSLVDRGYVLGAKTYTAKQTFLLSTTAAAAINIPNGATPTTPANGDIWQQNNHLFARLNGVTVQFDANGTVTSVTSANGDATIATTTTTPVITIVSAPKLTTARTINGTSFDGTANITATAAAGTLTGTTLNSTVVSSSLTSVATIGTGTWNATNIALGKGGTGGALSDPGAHSLWGWDDTDNTIGFWVIGANLSYNHATHTLSATSGGITNSAANNQVGISDGTNIIGDTDFTFTGGNTVNITNLSVSTLLTAPSNLNISAASVQITNTSSFGTITSSASSLVSYLRGTDATTNTAASSLIIERLTSGTPANNIGSRIEYRVQTASGAIQGVYLDAVAMNITSGSESFDYVIRTLGSGTGITERFRASENLVTAMAYGVPTNLTNLEQINETTTSRTVSESDRNHLVYIKNAGSTTVTLPNGLSTGYMITFWMYESSGTMTLTASTTLRTPGGLTQLLNDRETATCWHEGSNIWNCKGDLH